MGPIHDDGGNESHARLTDPRTEGEGEGVGHGQRHHLNMHIGVFNVFVCGSMCLKG